MTPKSGLNLIRIILVATFSTILISCDKDEPFSISESEETAMVNESTSADALTEEELQSIEEELRQNPQGGRISGESCATVTWDAEAKVVTLDLGDGCVGVHGRERSGKVIITYGGEFGDNLANRIITFDNYFVNNKQLTGSIELRDFNEDDNGNLTATRKRIDLTVHFPDGGTFTSNGSTTLTWLEGAGDGIVSNDVYSITGSYQGVSSRGRKITHTITEPVIVKPACFIDGGFARVQGKIEVLIEGERRERVRTINFGDGSCDTQITVTINGKDHTVTIS